MISGIINSTPFSVYNLNGEMIVWNPDYYIQWLPSDISGSFTMEGSTYNLEDYGGVFYFSDGLVTSGAFMSNSDIVSIATNADEIQDNAFMVCTALVSASLSTCSVIGSTAFYKCYSLSSVYAPYVESVSWMGFEYCSSLTSIDLPNCSYIDGAAFGYCLSLSRISAPKVEYINRQAFFSCPLLASVYLPSCSVIESGAFRRCYALSYAGLPVCESVGSYAFTSCSSLTDIVLPSCSFIGEQAFSGCRSFSTITLTGYSSVCVLSNSNAMQGTKITPTTGFIFVPNSLYESYRVAPEWSYFFPRIMPMSWSSNYIRWTPSTLSGYFSISGTEYKMSDWNGYFNGFDGVITSSAFRLYHSGYTTSKLTYIETNATRIEESAFYGINVCSCVSLSKCSYIGSHAFDGSNFTTHYGELRKIYAPNCEYIGHGAFANHWYLSAINLPKCSYIGPAAFLDAGADPPYSSTTYMTQVSLPKCEYIDIGGLARLGYAGRIQLPKCSYIGEEAFGVAKISGITALDCKYVGPSAFLQCSNLTDVDLDACEYVGSYAFESCSNLTDIVLNCSYIGDSAFYDTNLSVLKITYSSVCSLGTSVFRSTPLMAGTGSIYVPSSLVSAYKTNLRWLVFRDQIYPIPS